MKYKIQLMLSMLIFGSIGIFVRICGLPSGLLASVRGVFGSLVLLLIGLAAKKRLSLTNVKKNIKILLTAGIAIGFNWILLFEAYRFTTVAVATVCYYLAPVFIAVLSAIVFKEKLTAVKIICIAVSLAGTVFVSGVSKTGVNKTTIIGAALGIGAAVFYAAAVTLNKRLKDISSVDATTVQLFIAGIAVLPYAFIKSDWGVGSFSLKQLAALIIIVVVHTGIAYAMYFSAVHKLDGQTAAVLSYIDPMTAIVLSALVLNEKMTVMSIIGAAMILCSTLISEIFGNKRDRKQTDLQL